METENKATMINLENQIIPIKKIINSPISNNEKCFWKTLMCLAIVIFFGVIIISSIIKEKN